MQGSDGMRQKDSNHSMCPDETCGDVVLDRVIFKAWWRAGCKKRQLVERKMWPQSDGHKHKEAISESG